MYMIVRPHGGAAGVEVFKNNERQAAAIVERASSPPLARFLRQLPLGTAPQEFIPTTWFPE
jgi:hypothetical protein